MPLIHNPPFHMHYRPQGPPVGQPYVGLLQDPVHGSARGRRGQRQARQRLPDPTQRRQQGLSRGGGRALRRRLRRLRR